MLEKTENFVIDINLHYKENEARKQQNNTSC